MFRERSDDGVGQSLGAAHLPLREAVLEALRSAIISGEYQPGERLFEEEIAHRFDVSRNPIREAFQALSRDGFVTLEPRRGARVSTIDERRAADLFELRQPLEGLVARLAADRRTDDQARRLTEVVESARSAVAAGRLDELPQLNTAFHQLLAEAAANEMLAVTLARLSSMIQWIYSARIHQRFDDSWVEHEAIVDAIVAGDGELARTLGERHIVSARDAFLS